MIFRSNHGGCPKGGWYERIGPHASAWRPGELLRAATLAPDDHRWPYYRGFYYAAQSREASLRRADAFLGHLSRGEAEAALALTSDAFREARTADDLKAAFDAKVRLRGKLVSWEALKVYVQPESGNLDRLNLRCEFSLTWEAGESRCSMTSWLNPRELEGPVDPPIDEFMSD